MSSTRVEDLMVQICPFDVKLYVKMAEGVLQPVCNDGASIAMTTPFNEMKLQALTFLDTKGEGVVSGLNCRMDMPICHGPNIRFAVCMDGASTATNAKLPTDKLSTQTVVYSNTTVSLAELMFDEGKARTSPILLLATSSDEKHSKFVLRLTPKATSAHYSTANCAHIEKISEQHLSSTVIARALWQCQETRRKAMIEHMKTQGCAEEQTEGFYMTLPLGSLYDISSGEAQEATVDAPQWNALVQKTSNKLAESHVFKLCESMVIFMTHCVASMGIEIGNPDAVRVFMQTCDAGTDGKNWLNQNIQESMRTANEGSFVYTSDSEIRGFAVLNREDGVYFAAQMAPSGEKQNLFGMDPLTCAMHLSHKCEALKMRAKATLASALENEPEEGHAALHATCARDVSKALQFQSGYRYEADCEDAACVLAGVAHTAATMDSDHLTACVNRVMGSSVFSEKAAGLKDSILVALPYMREHLSRLQVGLCFAHASNISQIKSAVKEPLLLGVKAKFEKLVSRVNEHNMTGHACLFDVSASSHAAPVLTLKAGLGEAPAHALFQQREIFGVQACEGTNPVDLVTTDTRCTLMTTSSLPVLNTQLSSINGDMPRTAARCIVSEIAAKSAKNITGLDTSSVTYTTTKASFYNSMISIGSGYLWSQNAGPVLATLPATVLPSANIASIGDSGVRTFSVEGVLLSDVTINGRVYTEDRLLDMVVGAASCLAPSLDHIMQTLESSSFHIRADAPPAHAHHLSRVVMRGSLLPYTEDMHTDAHAAEDAARSVAAKKVHGNALAVSINSDTWHLYVPHS